MSVLSMYRVFNRWGIISAEWSDASCLLRRLGSDCNRKIVECKNKRLIFHPYYLLDILYLL